MRRRLLCGSRSILVGHDTSNRANMTRCQSCWRTLVAQVLLHQISESGCPSLVPQASFLQGSFQASLRLRDPRRGGTIAPSEPPASRDAATGVAKVTRRVALPEISRFLGIIIVMYYNDHAPPHFHARYGDFEAVIAIDSGEVVEGRLPPRVLGLGTSPRGIDRRLAPRARAQGALSHQPAGVGACCQNCKTRLIEAATASR